nr:HD domain-containing protein [Desulfobacula sp.]
MKLDSLQIIEKFYDPGTRLYDILVGHSRIVAEKSLEIARGLPHLNPDLDFIETAAMLHDIGIFLTRSESIGCLGKAAYVCHGYLGRELLDDLGLPPEYGLVSERHTGAGITRENIVLNKLPLPQREMVPLSLEEKIICAADKYHSKNPKFSGRNITTAEVVEELRKINDDHAGRFSIWAKEFGL